MLSFFHTRYTNNNKQQVNVNLSNRNYHIQDIKNVQHKNVYITWDYRKFPSHPFAAENFETRGRNTILSHFRYRVGPELGKGICAIFGFHVYVHPVLLNFINIGHQLLIHHMNQVIPMLKFITITKYLNITIIG